jgi:hypothetical protein
LLKLKGVLRFQSLNKIKKKKASKIHTPAFFFYFYFKKET